jgi:hypothetical protein
VALVEPWGGFGGALVEPWWSLGVALVKPWGSLGVALECLCGAYQQALGWPWVALCSPLSDFSFCPTVALDGLARLRDIGCWMFDVGCSMSSGFSFQLSAFQLLPNRMPSAVSSDESLQDNAGLVSRGGQDLPGADSRAPRGRTHRRAASACRFSERLTEAILCFAVVFSPWVFATTQELRRQRGIGGLHALPRCSDFVGGRHVTGYRRVRGRIICAWAGGRSPPYVPVSATPATVTPGGSGEVPRGGHNCAAP